MADIKTHLRELSVAVSIGLESKGLPVDVDYLSNACNFYNTAVDIINNDISSAQNIKSLQVFSDDYRQILINGFKLGKHITNTFNFNDSAKIIWCGNYTQSSEPTDLMVNGIRFSLKEQSFILENMGLYKLINLMTGLQVKRGLNIFKEFANYEYNSWFDYTWQKLCESTSDWHFVHSKGKYESYISLQSNMVILNYNNHITSEVPINAKLSTFESRTCSKTREKVFSKWINNEISNDSEYIRLKKICAERAGYRFCEFVNNNFDPNGLKRLLQIRDYEYYYAKTTSTGIVLLKVPSKQYFYNEFAMKKFTYSVPDSQLNIHTVIENLNTHRQIILRNECRFSHGQFNGTPEAKMYYDSGSDLSVIYTIV